MIARFTMRAAGLALLRAISTPRLSIGDMGAASSLSSFIGGGDWFSSVFGFSETWSYKKNQRHFKMEGDVLVCPTAQWPRQHVGPWETPSVAELRERVSNLDSPPPGGLRFENLATLAGVQHLIADPSNEGAIFQVASQFNALEMMGPHATPSDGVAIYARDPTQGPKCAIACPAATVFRNYLVGGGAGQGETQLDTLKDVGAVVGNEDGAYWEMRNGYALPTTSSAIKQLSARLAADPALRAAATGALRVGVHWDTQVRPPGTHRVCQVFASALPVAYASAPAASWAPFAKLVLRAAYEATLLAASCKAAARGERVRLYLTLLGGGAFGNQMGWIRDALERALQAHRDAPLDVFLVHYGHSVPAGWANVLGGTVRRVNVGT